MKKIYFAAALALAATASMSAKELTFYLNQTEKVEPGKEITVSCLEKRMETEEGIMGMLDPHLYIMGDVAGQVTATAECTSGQEIQFCLGGQCKSAATVTVTDNIKAGEMNNMRFEYIFTYPPVKFEDIPTVTTNISASYVGDESTLVSFTIVMDKGENAVSVIGIDNDFRPVNGGIEYSFEGTADVALYDLSGKKVLGAALSGQGTLSTAGLPAGIYVYAVNGCVSKSGKIAIK